VLPVLHLKPGVFYHGTEPVDVVATVGTGLVVLMMHPPTSQTVIFHSDLTPAGRDSDSEPSFRFLDTAFACAFEIFKQQNINFYELVIKIFGGAGSPRESHLEQAEGLDNVILAQQILKSLSLTPEAYDVGGAWGRELKITSDTGVVLLRRLRRRDEDVT